MNNSKALNIINAGEGLNVEFKESSSRLNRDVFSTVCAFLNRSGGHLFLGVKDDGTITGICKKDVAKLKKDFVTSINNPIKLSPSFYLSVDEIEINDKVVLYIYIPESSQVHRCNGKIYDRNEDGNLDITDNANLVYSLYIRKQSSHTENRIYFPMLRFSN